MSVRQIEVPADARAASTLPRVDYADAFVLPVPPGRTAEELARTILEEAPLATRTVLLSGWSALGLQLTRARPAILGWPIRQSTPERVLLGAESRIGMPAELLFDRREGALLCCTLVHHGNAGARTVWAATEPLHVPIVRRLLADAARRL